MSIRWNWSDAWLLRSIELAAGDKESGTDLKGILMMGDVINHAIFTVDEIKQGLEKLISIDFVKIENNRFYLTDKFYRECASIGHHSKDVMETLNQLESLLNTKKVSKANIVRLGANIISKRIFSTAYGQYQQQFRQ